MSIFHALSGLMLLTWATLANAQTLSPTPPPGDPETTAIFLRVHASLLDDIDALSARNTAAAQAAYKELAERIGVKAATLPKLQTAHRRLQGDVGKLDQEILAYLHNRAAQLTTVDATVLRKFEQQRQESIQAAVRGLEADLGSDWIVIKQYVDTTFRHYIKRSTLQ
ncbi:MAG: hypothetical protein NTZ56_22695 [Acidobacteria bacterium]|nr:hypothetical protein [Acidobacteriota bacterium]